MADFPTYMRLTDIVEETDPRLMRTAMESGPIKQARFQSRAKRTRDVTYECDYTDFSSFVTWHNTSINQGADNFNWTDPLDNTVKVALMVAGRFRTRPYKPLNVMVITFQIETFENA